MTYYFDPDIAKQEPMPEIMTAQTSEGWRAWMPGTKLECIEASKGMAIRSLRELYREKLDCDVYLENYAKRLKRHD